MAHLLNENDSMLLWHLFHASSLRRCFCWPRYTASMLCFGRRHPWCRAFNASMPRSVRPCLHSSCSLRFPFWSNFSALASPPRRRRLAVSFMDRSSPPSGRLAAVLDRCLRFAYYGLMESLYRAPCLHCAGRASLHSQLVPYPRYAAAPSHARCAPARAARGACPPSPPSCNREIPSRICDTHPRD